LLEDDTEAGEIDADGAKVAEDAQQVSWIPVLTDLRAVLLASLVLVSNFIRGMNAFAQPQYALYVLGLSAGYLGWLFSFVFVGFMIAVPILSYFRDSVCAKKNAKIVCAWYCAAGLALKGVIFGCTFTTNSVEVFTAFLPLFGVGSAAIDNSWVPLMASHIKLGYGDKFLPRAMAMAGSCRSLGFVLGSVVTGALLEMFTYDAVFLVTGAAVILYSGFFIFTWFMAPCLPTFKEVNLNKADEQ